jgi:hypothetical protein
MLTASHDFNNDGHSDVLWRNNVSGQVAMWFMKGAAVASANSVGAATTDWAIVGQRDFNRDGFADILWRNGTSGQVVIWLMNGANVIGGGSPGTVTTDWSVAGTGDFNNDGFGDVLWYNTSTGQVVIWLMNGTTVIGGGSPGAAARRVQLCRLNGPSPAPVILMETAKATSSGTTVRLVRWWYGC